MAHGVKSFYLAEVHIHEQTPLEERLAQIRAVQGGARMFESPCLSDHPRLAAYAIARPDQLDLALPRHADRWVHTLDDAQVARYAAQLDVVLAAARAHGRALEDVLCEVLSTQPYPLQRVLEGHGLGRFRVTQKADLSNPNDVYRSENARALYSL